METVVELEQRRPMGAAGLAGGLGAAGAAAFVVGVWATADPRILGVGAAGSVSPVAPVVGPFLVALGALMAMCAWGVWTLRAWAWWAALALSMAAMGLTLGSTPWTLSLLALIVYLFTVRGVFDGDPPVFQGRATH
jgi:hypothetical protein